MELNGLPESEWFAIRPNQIYILVMYFASLLHKLHLFFPSAISSSFIVTNKMSGQKLTM